MAMFALSRRLFLVFTLMLGWVLLAISGFGASHRHAKAPTKSEIHAYLALVSAVEKHDVARVKLLIHQGANVNLKVSCAQLGVNYQGSPLTTAASRGDFEMVRLLLALGAKINDPDPNDATAVQCARTVGLGKYLLRHGARLRDVSVLLNYGAFASAPYGELKDALALGGDVNGQYAGDGYTPLICALGRQNRGAVKLFLEHGAKPNLADDDGKSPLMYAARGYDAEGGSRCSPECGALLIAYGSDVNARDRHGNTALMYLWDNNPFEGGNTGGFARLLIEHGARLDFQNHDGKTALDLARHAGDAGLIDALELQVRRRHLRHVATVKYRPRPSFSQYDYDPSTLPEAVKQGNLKWVNRFLRQGVNPDAFLRTNMEGLPILDASCTGLKDGYVYPFSILKSLIRHGANVNASDTLGTTPLMTAAETNSLDALQLLLRHGVHINAYDNDGNTALMRASNYYQVEAAHVLLKHGANVNVRNSDGMTALILVSRIYLCDCFADRQSICELAADLIRHGARLDVKDKTGHTALDYARQSHFHALCRLLESGR